ncbi:uncharacterized protein EHS24_000137 [Apiotrichum porosum]|uniref:Uncharacterized protein n=1 Tax=Apiotrichum porosum TaxID=105984 RepID=A0A427Y9C2_9TREE|nr:uncharacterized protein EHS24_000137 [Apiotrichum porosum]RSH87625.1 hypothetical protein EHS24_000137 [Apiotrichum porosum]
MGANLEVFKFATYLFIPLFAMVHFGDPNWYEHHVQPYKEKVWPAYESTNKPPKTSADLHVELDRLKNERRARAGLAPLAHSHASSAAPAESSVLAAVGDRTGSSWAESSEKRLV